MLEIDNNKCAMYLVPFKGSSKDITEYALFISYTDGITNFKTTNKIEEIFFLYRKFNSEAPNFYQLIFPKSQEDLDQIYSQIKEDSLLSRDCLRELPEDIRKNLELILENESKRQIYFSQSS